MPTPFPFVANSVLTAAQLNSITELPTRTLTGSGVAVAADSYSRVILNGTSITYTINTSTFSAGQVVELYNANSTAATIAAGAGVTLNGAAGLTLAQYQTAELYAISSTSFVLWKSDSPATSSGLTVVKSETAFSGAATVTADNIFTSTYTNYRLLVRYQTSSTGNLLLKFRAGGVNTSTNYNLQVEYIQNTTLTGARLLNRSSIDIGVYTNGSFNSFVVMDIVAPNVLTQTLFNISNSYGFGSYTSPEYFIAGGNQTATTQFDGIELSTSLGTITGEYTVYGYAKS